MLPLLDCCHLPIWRSYPLFPKSRSPAPKWSARPGNPAPFLWLAPSSAPLTPNLLCSNLLYRNPSSPQPPDKTPPFLYILLCGENSSPSILPLQTASSTPFLAFLPSDSLPWGLILGGALDQSLLPITYLLSLLFSIFSFSIDWFLLIDLKKNVMVVKHA